MSNRKSNWLSYRDYKTVNKLCSLIERKLHEIEITEFRFDIVCRKQESLYKGEGYRRSVSLVLQIDENTTDGKHEEIYGLLWGNMFDIEDTVMEILTEESSIGFGSLSIEHSYDPMFEYHLMFE